MSASLANWALPRIGRLLPIDEESLTEIITYAASLSKEAGAEHLKNLLGDSTQALEFISGFNSRREDVIPPQTNTNRTNPPPDTPSESVSSPRRRPGKKPKAPLHNAGPARQPEGFGNVTGGYQKSYESDSYVPGSKRQQAPPPKSLSTALSLSQDPVALQVPTLSQTISSSPGTSRDPSPGQDRQKLPPSASGNLISDFMPNVRTKQSKKPAHPTYFGSSTPRTQITATTSSIQDLTSAIAALEIATNPAISSERRHCGCNASLHPLFETAPNCMSCGKIICALEGLQPCSYCNAPILSKDQVDSMIRALKDERGVEKMATHNAGVASGRGTPMFGNSTPESSGDESSSAAARARAHRDKLLAFQRENAQRTRIHDEAADYDTTLTPGTTQWMSPLQRAAALKRQQKYMRELQEASRPEWEKKRTVMSMSIKNGKLVKSYTKEKAPPLTPEINDQDAQDSAVEGGDSQQLTAGGKGAFSNNPLLVSGKLVRPVWQPKHDQASNEDDEARSSARTRKSVWRKVQDDNEDNEQWILDGGLRGYGTESRLMEDGSQQECG